MKARGHLPIAELGSLALEPQHMFDAIDASDHLLRKGEEAVGERRCRGSAEKMRRRSRS